jgi:hypothetical protein
MAFLDGPYGPTIRCKTTSVLRKHEEGTDGLFTLLCGEHEEDIEYTDDLFTLPVLAAWLDDHDLIEITVVSRRIGFVKTFTKRYKDNAHG